MADCSKEQRTRKIFCSSTVLLVVSGRIALQAQHGRPCNRRDRRAATDDVNRSTKSA